MSAAFQLHLPMAMLRFLIVSTLVLAPSLAPAATFGPPLLDITRQCDSITHGNATAMSECVVGESEARAELLQKWDRYGNAEAQRCVKLGRQSRRHPYAEMLSCLNAAPAPVTTKAAKAGQKPRAARPSPNKQSPAKSGAAKPVPAVAPSGSGAK